MASSRKILTAGAVGVAALALIGAGAGATFKTSTSSAQTITAGTIRVVVYSDTANAPCTTPGGDCTSLTFPNVAPVGSTFETATHRVYIKNVGNIPVTETVMNLSDTSVGPASASSYLRAQTNVCIKSAASVGSADWVVANGPLTKGESLTPAVTMNVGPTLDLAANGGIDYYDVTFYAGKDSACGGVTSAGSGTAEAWGVTHVEGSPAGGSTRDYVTPPSLTNDAMGGSITPKISFNFEG